VLWLLCCGLGTACGTRAAGPSPDQTPAADSAPPAPDAAGGAPSAGCGRAGGRYRPGTQPGALRIGATDRSFLVRLPPAYDAARPRAVVLLFHGGLGTGAQMEESSLMSPIADREGFIVAYPDGLNRSWNAGTCCGPPAEQGIDDVGFVAALLDHLEAELCIDRRRIYAGGMSNGAMLSHRLGCDLATRIAAIAPVSGTNVASPCAPARRVAVMQIQGRDDKHVPWEGGAGCGIAGVPFTSVPDTIAGWRQRNGCTAGPAALLVEQGDGRCEREGACPPEGEVVLCTIAGGGHAWPGGSPRQGGSPACMRAGEGAQSRSFIASEQMWRFFAAHPAPAQ
jgi:polyhydroxybutyrate depolymerase